jgi:two-component system, NtrC family, response regulator AtoC
MMGMHQVEAQTRTLDVVADDGDAPSSSLMVIGDMSSRRISLPRDGVLHIGRDAEADIQIESVAASRRHAKLVLVGGKAHIADLDSYNGTMVNGERIKGSCSLASGDVITIAKTLLVLRVASSTQAHSLIDMEAMRRRIAEELARASEYGRSFAVVVLKVREKNMSRPLGLTAVAALRPMDALAVHGANLVALLPELDVEAARTQVAALLAAVTPIIPEARAGFASYPCDGNDVDTLLTGARAAVGHAGPGAVCFASEVVAEHVVGDSTFIVADPAMVKLYELVRRLAASSLSVLIVGETGTGKENAAHALHYWSARSEKPFVALNCAALPETLVESEIFGYERGAFSDAKSAKPGLLERAHGGTVFLDEVGDLPIAVQVKLLRAIEHKRFLRLGDTREREIDVRIVSATNVDLDAAVDQKRFRSDLLYRLSAAVVALPPLRDRRREVPVLARAFVERERSRQQRQPLEISAATMAALCSFEFPGNVRELKNAMEYAVTTAEGATIELWNLPDRIRGQSGPPPDDDAARDDGAARGDGAAGRRRFRAVSDEIRELERRRIVEALEAHDGVKTHAAAAIGMPIRTFTFKLKQYKIDT